MESLGAYVLEGLLIALVLYSLWVFFAAYMMYRQERRSYGEVGFARAFFFSLFCLYGSMICCVLVLPVIVFERGTKSVKVRNAAFQKNQQVSKKIFRFFFGDPVVQGLENLPQEGDRPVVFVMNHQSMVDVALSFFLDRRFAFVSKAITFLLPGAGTLMRLCHFIPLKRGNKASILRMFEKCAQAMESDCNIVIFPQGTRKRHEWVPFKDGAFSFAVDNNYTVVPVTLALPADLWTARRRSRRGGGGGGGGGGPPGRCVLTVHPPQRPPPGGRREGGKAVGANGGAAATALREACQKSVCEALPDGYFDSNDTYVSVTKSSSMLLAANQTDSSSLEETLVLSDERHLV